MPQEESLENLRQQIDGVNTELIKILSKRAAIAQKIGKTKNGKAVYRPSREAQILDVVKKNNPGPLPDASIQTVFKEIIAACRNLEKQLKASYLGPAGTYSEEAARKHLGSTCDFVPYSTLDEVVRAVENDEADVAVVPIENSTEGGVNRTHDILLETSLKICGEIVLPIHHQLLSKSNTLNQITEVIAHPQALAQCRAWLDAYLPGAERRAAGSNSEAAKLAAGHSSKAAIAGRRAGQLYGLGALASNIEDDPSNTTRFLVLGNVPTQPTGKDKTSLVCSTPNKPGALAAVLDIFNKASINIVRLESRPARNCVWEYIFYVDIDGHSDDIAISGALKELASKTTLLKILGAYLY